MKLIVNLPKSGEGKKYLLPYQYVATFTGSIAIVCTGMIFGWATPSLPQLLSPDSPIKVTSSDGSWLAVIPCITAAFGCLLTAYFVDKIGRKRSMLLVTPLYFSSWVIIALSHTVEAFYVARFIGGIADGIAFTAFPMYLGEIADSKIRGMLCSSIPITTVLGFMIVSIIGAQFSIKNTAYISAVLPIVHFVLFYFMPESPYFLLMKGKEEEARAMMKKLRNMENVDEEMNRMQKSLQEEIENKGSIWDLFTVKSNRKSVYIVVGLRGLQQFCGTMAINFYATIIFHESGSSLSPTSCTSIYFGVQVICSIFCSMLVDRIGRRPLLIISSIGCAITLAIEGSYFYIRDCTEIDLSKLTVIPVAALLCYNVVLNIGIGTIPVTMLGELFSTNVKAFALCMADIYFGLVVVVVSKFFQIMNDGFGMYVPFFTFSAFSVGALIFVVFCIPETKGKTLEEIQEYFKRSKKSIKADVETSTGG